jgi:hypothetical protein
LSIGIAQNPSIAAVRAELLRECDRLTLQFLIMRNIHLKNKKNVAIIANKWRLADNLKS